MNERVRFISRLLEGETLSVLCREFGISRKTGYKFLNRYSSSGVNGLLDQARIAKTLPHKTASEVERLIFKARELKPHWGPKKLKNRLEGMYPKLKIPAESTIAEILKRNGYIQVKRRRRGHNYYPTELSQSKGPNDVWSVDFKGQFPLKNKLLCYPLTISDHFSRYLITCEALPDTKSGAVFEAFECAFREHGMPKIIRSDNGTPFASSGLGGLSRLNAWFIRLGIRPERIEPGHPEQNGRHERIHLTMQKEVVRPASDNMLQQQERLDKFRDEYNIERPHEALKMKKPAELYYPSTTPYPQQLKDPEYELHDLIRRVKPDGRITLPGERRCYITRALRGQKVGLRTLEKNIWQLHYCELELGYIDARTTPHVVIDNPMEPNET